MDATAREPCLTQAQADALAAQASANGGIVDTDPPEECAFLKDPNITRVARSRPRRRRLRDCARYNKPEISRKLVTQKLVACVAITAGSRRS